MNNSEKENRIRIEAFLKQADEALESQNWAELAGHLVNALNIDPKDRYIKKFLAYIETERQVGNITPEEYNSISVNIFLIKAGKALESKNWVGAATYFANAFNIEQKSTEIENFIAQIETKRKVGSIKNEDLEIFFETLKNVENVDTLIRDKGVIKENRFEKLTEKEEEGGLTSGYKAKERISDHTFMLKTFQKKPNIESKKISLDREDDVREFIAGDLYKIVLYDRVPRIAAVESVDPDTIQIRSKYMSKALSLYDFINSGGKFSDIDGIEKIFSACAILGEKDHHTRNLMVRPSHDGVARELGRKDLVKIDHGRSFLRYPNNFTEFARYIVRQSEPRKYKENDTYEDYFKGREFKFNLHKYASHLSEMLFRLDDDTVKEIVEKKIDEIKRLGFVLTGTSFKK